MQYHIYLALTCFVLVLIGLIDNLTEAWHCYVT